jgi:hypothetical protein
MSGSDLRAGCCGHPGFAALLDRRCTGMTRSELFGLKPFVVSARSAVEK